MFQTQRARIRLRLPRPACLVFTRQLLPKKVSEVQHNRFEREAAYILRSRRHSTFWRYHLHSIKRHKIHRLLCLRSLRFFCRIGLGANLVHLRLPFHRRRQKVPSCSNRIQHWRQLRTNVRYNPQRGGVSKKGLANNDCCKCEASWFWFHGGVAWLQK